MTLVNVYKSQGSYKAALETLEILQEREKNNNEIEKEKLIITSLINARENNE